MRKIILMLGMLVMLVVSALLLATGSTGNPQGEEAKKRWFPSLQTLRLAWLVTAAALILTILFPATIRIRRQCFS